MNEIYTDIELLKLVLNRLKDLRIAQETLLAQLKDVVELLENK
jgi:hypothetical protein